jgi:hypothetical protein
MDDQEINDQLDQIAEKLTSPWAINAVHACRPGHPLGNATEYPFLGAWLAVAPRLGMRGPEATWLHDMARERKELDKFDENVRRLLS